jgi:hypothetical protein
VINGFRKYLIIGRPISAFGVPTGLTALTGFVEAPRWLQAANRRATTPGSTGNT